MISKLLTESFFVKKLDYIILFLCSMLFISLTFASTGQIGLLSGLCFLTFIAKIILKRETKLKFSEFDRFIFIYFTIAALSVAFSPLLFSSIKGFLKLLTYLCLYITFFNVLEGNKKRIYIIFAIIATSAFGESLIAIWQNFLGVDALASWQDQTGVNPEQLMTRVYGTLKPFNPNLLAGYLVASSCFAAGLFFLCALKKKVRLAGLSLIATLCIMASIIFTGSRGAYAALFVMVSGIVLTSGHIIWHDFKEKLWLKKLWLFLLFSGIAAVLIVIFSSPALQHRILSIFTVKDDSSNAFRLNVYMASFKMFLDNWLIGIGTGNETFRLMYGLYMRTGFDALGTYSVPLEIAVESGIFALLAYFTFIANIFIKGIKSLFIKSPLEEKTGKNPEENPERNPEKNIEKTPEKAPPKTIIEEKIIILTCVIAIAGIMAHGLVDTVFFRPQVQILFWMLVAIAGTPFSKKRA